MFHSWTLRTSPTESANTVDIVDNFGFVNLVDLGHQPDALVDFVEFVEFVYLGSPHATC